MKGREIGRLRCLPGVLPQNSGRAGESIQPPTPTTPDSWVPDQFPLRALRKQLIPHSSTGTGDIHIISSAPCGNAVTSGVDPGARKGTEIPCLPSLCGREQRASMYEVTGTQRAELGSLQRPGGPYAMAVPRDPHGSRAHGARSCTASSPCSPCRGGKVASLPWLTVGHTAGRGLIPGPWIITASLMQPPASP